MRNSDDIATWVVGHPPRCLAPFALSSPTTEGRQTVCFRLASQEGQTVGALLGHDLSRLNPDYEGDTTFVSPLSIAWGGDDAPVPLLDTDIHGYTGELHDSAKFRGSGEPEAFVCSGCQGRAFRFVVSFHYWDAVYDLWEDEPDIAVEDYFNLFTLVAECTTCPKRHNASEIDL